MYVFKYELFVYFESIDSNKNRRKEKMIFTRKYINNKKYIKMGRFIYGDIDWKMYHYQESNNADFFGVKGRFNYLFHDCQYKVPIEDLSAYKNDKNYKLYCKDCFDSFEDNINHLLENEFIDENDREDGMCCVFLSDDTYNYSFTKEHLPQVKEGCSKLKEQLNSYSDLFKEVKSQDRGIMIHFNEKELEDIDKNYEIRKKIVTYSLGLQILFCLDKKESCIFVSEAY